MSVGNDIHFTCRLFDLLASEGVRTWIFGGWAEELRGLCVPREHGDVDLLYPAADFSAVDTVLARRADFHEIEVKRFNHKRAFVYEGTMIELFLAQEDAEGLYTDFSGRFRFDWPAGTLASRGGLPVVGRAALIAYRRLHSRIHAPAIA